MDEINYKAEFEDLLDIAEQVLTRVDFENREVSRFAPLAVLQAAIKRYRVLLPDREWLID